MEALVVYVVLGIALVAFIAYLWRSSVLARRGEGARGFTITTSTALTDTGWIVSVTIRNSIDAPAEIAYFIDARQGNRVFDPNPRETKNHRLNPGVQVTDEWHLYDIPGDERIERVNVYSPRRDRSHRLIARTDFPA